MTKSELKRKWAKEVEEKFVGRRITGVRYMTAGEVAAAGWGHSAVVLRLDDGALIHPMSDDEGNEAGSLATTYDDLPVVPVI